MKVIIILSSLFFLFAFSTQAQTKRIRHKSHSGTDKTFNPKTVEGNFGITESHGEIKEDKSSNYKLLYSLIGTHYTYYLFYTEREDRNVNVCLEKDKIIETVECNSYSKDSDAIKTRLIQKLNKLRRKEKKKKRTRRRSRN